jgi:hypothetical protein
MPGTSSLGLLRSRPDPVRTGSITEDRAQPPTREGRPCGGRHERDRRDRGEPRGPRGEHVARAARGRARARCTARLAERAGFEPAVTFPPHALSRRALSAAQPPLQFRSCRRGDVRPGSDVAIRATERRRRSEPAALDRGRMAERVGFEPTVNRKAHAGFRNRSLQPLRHLSVGHAGTRNAPARVWMSRSSPAQPSTVRSRLF